MDSILKETTERTKGRTSMGEQNSTPDPLMSTVLAEITTIYEKLKKGRENDVYQISNFDLLPPILISEAEASLVPTVPTFQPRLSNYEPVGQARYLDFSKYNGIINKKYLYFSADTNLIQSDTLEGLSQNYKDLLQSEYYWLNITDPGEEDLAMLLNSFHVHDFTIADIREHETEEKIEFYQHYTFMSTRLLREVKFRHGPDAPPRKSQSNSITIAQDPPVDIDFNIIMFKSFVITMHDQEWPSINDMLGFLNLVSGETLLTPDWVLYSIFIELSQDAQYLLSRIEPRLNEHRLGSTVNLNEMSIVLRENYEMEFSLYTIEKFLKPKINILKTLKSKSGRRFEAAFLNLVNSICEDFVEILNDLKNMNHILEKSQDTFLALVNVEKNKEANDLAQVMKTITQVAVIFVPLEIIPAYFGMNVLIPWQADPDDPESDSLLPFWMIVVFSLLIGLMMYMMTAFYLRRVGTRLKHEEQESQDRRVSFAQKWRRAIAR